jgi:hypothetical protein
MIRRLVALLALATLGACGDSGTGPNSTQLEGTYSLRSINGSPLPYTVQSGVNSITLTSDVITIASNGTWTETLLYRQTINGVTANGAEADGGTWVRAGNDVTLDSNQSQGTAYSGTLSSGTLTFEDVGFVGVFRK